MSDLLDRLLERGLVGAAEAGRLRALEPGVLAEFLVQSGRLSRDQLDRLDPRTREIGADIPDDVAAVKDDARLRVGKFILMRCLGSGGMGEVWKAWDVQINRWVALKFLKGDDPEDMKRFYREANLASRLAHPGITRVYEVALDATRPYLALEFVDGDSLEGEKEGPRRAAEIVRDAARAVHYAHEQGVLHRDLKPANILESGDGRIYVTDFGLARTIERGATITVSGAIMGTPAYMAPEQAAGEKTGVGTDVYGLGATLYALVEARAPYEGESHLDVLKKISTQRPPEITVEDDLRLVLRKAMEREPADRYATAGELADDLERYLHGEPVVARPVGTVVRFARRLRRRPVISGAFLAVVALASTLVFLERSTEARMERMVNDRIHAGRTNFDQQSVRMREELRAACEAIAESPRILGDIEVAHPQIEAHAKYELEYRRISVDLLAITLRDGTPLFGHPPASAADPWLVLDGRLYHVWSVPIVDGARFVGAVFAAIEVDDATAGRLHELQAPEDGVAYVVGDRVVAASGVPRDELAVTGPGTFDRRLGGRAYRVEVTQLAPGSYAVLCVATDSGGRLRLGMRIATILLFVTAVGLVFFGLLRR